MKITGCSESPGIIEIRHSGLNVTFQHVIEPFNPVTNAEQTLKELSVLTLEFSDMKELDNLLYILSDYRRRCERRIGEYIDYPTQSRMIMEKLEKNRGLRKDD